MQSPVTMTLLIQGNFPEDTFPDWIARHANTLNLEGWVRPQGKHRIEVQVTGQPTLIDALEVACTLGPIDAQVDQISKREAKARDSNYRQVARFVRY